MLKGIEFENYKAFENGKLKIKPITILLGANSIGKSSLMQLILLLKQTFNFKGLYNSALKLNGKYLNLGEPENIFNNFNTDKAITFKISVSDDYGFIDQSLFLDEIAWKLKAIQREFVYNEAYIQTKLVKEKDLKSVSVRKLNRIYADFETKDLTLIEKAKEIIKGYKKYKRDLGDIENENSRHLKSNVLKNKKNINELIENIDIKSLEHTIKFLEAYNKIELKNLTYVYEIGFNKRNNSLIANSLKVINDDKVIIGYSTAKSKNGKDVHKIYSDLIEDKVLNKYRIEVGKNLKFKLLTFNTEVENRDRSIRLDRKIFESTFIQILSGILEPLIISLDESFINYVSPLRAYPKRYYFLDEANIGSSFNTIIGENLAEILKQNNSVKKKVNNWLSNFGFEVNVDKLQDVIHHLKVNQSGLKLDITDVGFGISQILPVIVQGFLSRSKSLTLIEQPEIHLHPKMQAELADLFIDMVKNDSQPDRALLIETHSEYLLRRLRRRISEGKISNRDVAIYFIKKEKKKSTIDEVDVSESGAFDWPSEFYDDELDDTIAFIKNQPAKIE
ncbi:AAA family ATPase [Maribacter litopenaei]|uniref:AAA family ATPase n=1 Tax=Maribacter litopenaei TaxID=2976127 RepID=A0ABY5Y7W5_9FLAO|nr:AAA family ATPase [Maribacter litopenaei]UWX55108.1 AAA family ATPase [Maribacter litopenaei]